jgi:pseudouridine-5'-phosphate glycosidase/pseudouridine kinase
VALELAKLKKANDPSSASHASDSSYFPSSADTGTANPGTVNPASRNALSSTSSSPLPIPLPQPLPPPWTSPHTGSATSQTKPGQPPDLAPPSVLVFGSAAIDITSQPSTELIPGTTTPGSIFVSPGGVGRNIAEAAQKSLSPGSVKLVTKIAFAPALGGISSLVSATSSTSTSMPMSTSSSTSARSNSDSKSSIDNANGSEPDAFGKLLMMEMVSSGLRLDGLIPEIEAKAINSISDPGSHGVASANTSGCSLTLSKSGDLVNGVADMGIVERLMPDTVSSFC